MSASLADLIGAAHEVEYEGKVYKITEPSQLAQAQFSRWLERRAREHAARSVEDERAQDKLLQFAGQDAAIGMYEYGGDLYSAALRTYAGLLKMVELVLREQNPEITETVLQGIMQHKLKQIAAAINAAGESDPKAQAAILRSAGLPSDFFTRSSRIHRSTKRTRKSRR